MTAAVTTPCRAALTAHAVALVRPFVELLGQPGSCDYPHVDRPCPEPVLARDRCWEHLGRCTARIKATAEPCRRMHCGIPRHLRIQEQAGAGGEAATGPAA